MKRELDQKKINFKLTSRFTFHLTITFNSLGHSFITQYYYMNNMKDIGFDNVLIYIYYAVS